MKYSSSGTPEVKATIINVFKKSHLAKHSYIAKVTSFGLFSGHYQTYIPETIRNYTLIYITLEKEVWSFTQMYMTGKKMCMVSEENGK